MSGRSRRVPISFWHPPPRTHLWPFGSFARIDLRFAWQKNAGPLLAPALRGREQRVVWKRRSGGPSVNAKESFAPTLLLIHPSYAGCRRSEEHTSELQSLMRISYAVFCLKKQT